MLEYIDNMDATTFYLLTAAVFIILFTAERLWTAVILLITKAFRRGHA